jgi:hypothetical protein
MDDSFLLNGSIDSGSDNYHVNTSVAKDNNPALLIFPRFWLMPISKV